MYARQIVDKTTLHVAENSRKGVPSQRYYKLGTFFFPEDRHIKARCSMKYLSAMPAGGVPIPG